MRSPVSVPTPGPAVHAEVSFSAATNMAQPRLASSGVVSVTREPFPGAMTEHWRYAEFSPQASVQIVGYQVWDGQGDSGDGHIDLPCRRGLEVGGAEGRMKQTGYTWGWHRALVHVLFRLIRPAFASSE